MRIGEKKGDWGSLIHDSTGMSQAVESQRQRIPQLRRHYSIYHKSDGSKKNGTKMASCSDEKSGWNRSKSVTNTNYSP